MRLNLNAILESDYEDETDIVILPPDGGDGNVTDIEEDDENVNQQLASLPNDVAGSLEMHRKDNMDTENDIPCAADNNKTKSPKPKRSRNANKPTEMKPNWIKSNNLDPMENGDIETLAMKRTDLINSSPGVIFELLFNDTIKTLIVNETERYASQNNKQLKLTKEEIEQFVGILLLTGYNTRPRQKMYWSKDDDVACPIVAKQMSRNRFEEIKSSLHFADNDHLEHGDKLAKVRPLQNEVKTSLQQFGIFSKNLSIDEQMVPYFGRHSIKMFIRGKPIRFGYKNWVLASSSGYPYKFETYMGASEGSEKGKPLGPRIVLGLLSVVENPKCHHVFFDNFFTSYNLLKSLKELDFKATGTIRENRTMKCPLQPSKIISKKERAFYDYRSDNNVMIVQWKDNKVVYMGSNTVGIEPINKVKRYSQKAKMNIEVPQPACFGEYNKGMGGVDILDRFISQYRPSINAKKWYWPLFLNCVGMLTVASWRVYVELGSEPKLDLLAFQREVVASLFSRKRNEPTGPSGRRIQKLNVGLHHPVQAEKQGRCALCKANTVKQCMECGVRLHPNCFLVYHDK